MHALQQIGLVAFGSAVGGVARWGVNLLTARWLGAAFPFGTLLINVSGSFFLGWFATMLTRRADGPLLIGMHAAELRLLVAVGFTGAFTTFSTFELESNALLSEGSSVAAVAYVAGSVFVGLLAVRWGIALAGGAQ